VPNPEQLKMIQAVIDRMARNSFALKGWTVTLVAALIGLAAADSNRSFALIAVYVVVVLAALDAYYLAIERAYRALYNSAASNAEDNGWDLTVERTKFGDVLQALLSPSIFYLHGIALLMSVAVALAA
jgi:hypothetical protein